MSRLGWLAACPFLVACAPRSPCRTEDFHRIARYSGVYAGRWQVVRGDTLTLPDPSLGDRFKLTVLSLQTDTVVVGRECLYRGSLIFSVPKAETLAVSWFGVPEHATIFGWPADLGPFAGIGLTPYGPDSLRGAILFDERLGVRATPGTTARFVAGRAR
jgi:hypothetical protein